MLKSFLIRFPRLYEAVQALRDRRFFRQGLRTGSFAQHGEDVTLLSLMRDAQASGAYVDVGCNHPFRLSNTYMLYRNGWRGLCVDPLPRFRDAFRTWRPDDVFICAAVGESGGQMPLFEFESDVLSTLDSELAAAYQAQGFRLLRQSLVQVRRIDDLLESQAVSAPLSLLSLDIEGHELSALRSIDLDRWRPEFVCMEALTADGRRNQAAIDYLASRGYRSEVDKGLNVIFRRMAAWPGGRDDPPQSAQP